MIHLLRSMHTVHLVFHMFMLEPVMPITFLSQSKSLPLPVIMDGKTKYEISWIIGSKIDYK